jgi:hypothetical protein
VAADNNRAPNKETHLQFLIVIAAFLLRGSSAAVEPNLDGSYVTTSLNGRTLPAELRIAAMQGDFRLFRLEQGVLTLRPNGRFTLYFRYYHQLVRRGNRPVPTPVMSESETGTYTVSNANIVFTPTKKKGSRSRPVIPATIAGDEIRANYTLENAGSNQRVTLVLHRDSRYW